MSVLYARLGDELYEELKSVAAKAKLPIRTVAEVILSERLGRPRHTLWSPVNKAIALHRNEKEGVSPT